MTSKTPKQKENEQKFLDTNCKRLQTPYSNMFRSMIRGKKRGDGLVPDESRLEDLRDMENLSTNEAIERYLLEKVQSEYKNSSRVPTMSSRNFGKGDSLIDNGNSKKTLNKLGEFFNRMRESTSVVPEDVFMLSYGTEARRARKQDVLEWIEDNVMV